MGGCASRPRDNTYTEVKPAEIPTAQDQNGDPPKQVDAGDASNAEPLVDLSTPKADAPTSVKTKDPFDAVSAEEVPLSSNTKEVVEEPAVVARSVPADAQAAEVKNVTEEAKVKEEKPAAVPEIVEVTATKKAAADAPKSDETKEIAAAAVSA
ncbi:hypothetical protein H6P81_008290 [Aristolochia fimbriata]|uniref:Uncharacterized protein n=1 Tax=Aristolochia fimbriata TaxID=158543 RepID=A0AAV7F6C2_ARIFI|nr:hypothetical protein H6P81_008290 [Aristolochia fimbriata]